MTKQIIIYLILVQGCISCSSKAPENIRFDITATYLDNFNKSVIEIDATIFSDNIDTIYFLTTSFTWDEQYSLQYDESNLELSPLLNCNATFPIILKIAPHDKYNFKAHFKYIKALKEIKLGYDFYKVEKSFDLTKFNSPGINYFSVIHYRSRGEKSIVWSGVKQINNCP